MCKSAPQDPALLFRKSLRVPSASTGQMGSAEEGVKQIFTRLSGQSPVKVWLKSCRNPLKSCVSEGTGRAVAGS